MIHKKTDKNIFCISHLTFCFLLGLLIVSCTPHHRAVYPSSVTPAIEHEFKMAEALYEKRDYTGAISAYAKFAQSQPYTKLTDEAVYKIGKIHFVNHQFDLAVNQFRELAAKTPDQNYKAKGNLMAGYALIEAGQGLAGRQQLTSVDTRYLSTRLAIQYYSLQINSRENEGAPRTEVDYYYFRLLDLYHQSEDPALANLEGSGNAFVSRGVAEARLQGWLAGPLDAKNIPDWFQKYPRGYVRPALDYKWGKSLLEAGLMNEAKNKLNKFVRANPTHPMAESARQLLASITPTTARTKTESLETQPIIGVLLPLTGREAPYSKSVLWGVECAVGRHEECVEFVSHSFPQLKTASLIVQESGNTTESVISGVDELISKKVMAIIGPVTGPLADAAARRAQEKGIPILPITQKSGIASIGNMVFPMGYTVSFQVKDLVLSAHEQGIKNLGIFYPDSTYGKEVADQFEKEVLSQGDKIVAKSSYSAIAPDYVADVRQLKSGIRNIAFTGQKEGDIAPFQALFVPDSYRNINKWIIALDNAHLSGVPLLGTNALNDPQLSKDLNTLFPGSYFLDIFYPHSQEPLIGSFNFACKKSTGKEATNLEALGFDAALALRQVASAQGTSRTAASQGLLSPLVWKGVTRIQGFDTLHNLQVKPYRLTIGDLGITEQKH